MRRHCLLPLLIAAAALCSCSADKYLLPGDMVLSKNEVRIEMMDGSKVSAEVKDAAAHAQHYLAPTPNKRFLDMRLGMRLYCSTNPDCESKWCQWWRNRGEAPVVFDAGAASHSVSQLVTLMKSKGCFNTTVSYDTLRSSDGSSVRAVYTIHASPRRIVDGITYHCRQADIDSLLKQWAAASPITPNSYYDRDLLTQDRDRIITNLRNQGYYRATSDLVHYRLDTTYDASLMHIIATVDMPYILTDSGRVTKPLQVYYIDNIYIYPNTTTALDNKGAHLLDTTVLPHTFRGMESNYYFISDKKISPSPSAIAHSLYLNKGQLYRPRTVSTTNSALLGLNNFKYVDISFVESPFSSDTHRLLDARIRLLGSNQHRISFSLDLTNASERDATESSFFTSGNIGLGTSIGYQNRNLFGGAEQLSVEGSLLIDIPKNIFSQTGRKNFGDIFDNFEGGLNVTLDFPTALLPFTSGIIWQRAKPHTIVGLNANYLYRKLSNIHYFMTDTEEDIILNRTNFGASFGYAWNHSRNSQHKLLPLNITYSKTPTGWEYYFQRFEETGDVHYIYMVDDYILLNTHYEFIHTNQRINTRQNFHYLKISAETAGNLLYGIDYAMHGQKANSNYNGTLEGKDSLFNGINYYQYFRFEGEYKQYFYWGEKSSLVLRALTGATIPYGHSDATPYEKNFIGGGPTTMRAWSIRELGPGQYERMEELKNMGYGEVLMVFNIEQRFPLVSILEGAAFVDVGNVWNYCDWFGDNYSDPLTPAQIIKGFAIDAGLGLRLNISFITLRFDYAWPIYDPGMPVEKRWISDNWSWSLGRLNFGLYYPF